MVRPPSIFISSTVSPVPRPGILAGASLMGGASSCKTALGLQN